MRALAGLEPDLVIDTGDNLGHLDAVPAVLEALGPLLERPGAFVMGSNDYYAPMLKNPVALPAARARGPAGQAAAAHGGPARGLPRRRAGWTWTTPGPGSRSTTGRSSWSAPTTRTSGPTGTPRWPGPADPAADLSLGVTHAPYRRVLDPMVADGFDLVLAGHTHGGQLCVPLLGALVTNCDLPRRQAKGLSTWSAGGRTAPLHVSAGLGTSPYAPVRFACRPEATLLTLVEMTGQPAPGSARLAGLHRGVAQLGSALRSGRRGRGFKSRHPDRRQPVFLQVRGAGCRRTGAKLP